MKITLDAHFMQIISNVYMILMKCLQLISKENIKSELLSANI